MAVIDQLELTDTIGQMRDKINDIINIVNGTQIKLEKSGDPTKYVILTYDGANIIITDENDVVKTIDTTT